jgi:hypothetical protein
VGSDIFFLVNPLMEVELPVAVSADTDVENDVIRIASATVHA